ncbi:MAG: hypothetical protein OXH68_08705 [Gammaproteobacteria bacterium]|nr:hypothetical protein [Gammaproteobacteria bacterium]
MSATTATPPAASGELPAAIQQLLSAQGFYSPIELLLATNRLAYDDYQAWRRGDHQTLDDLFPDGVDAARSFLDDAATWVRGLHLDAETVPLLGTETVGGIELTASANAHLDDLLHTEYRRDVDREQPDLFLDDTQAEAQNRLADAIVSRDAAASGEMLRRLAALDIGHWAISHAMTLIEALQAARPTGTDGARDRLDEVENRWLPAASALLRSDARDFLSPLWRDVGRAFEGHPFEPDDARAHASWAYLHGLDWSGVKRTVLGEPAWQTEPMLQVRLAHAQWRLGERRYAIRTWFALCWHAPGHFAESIESATFPSSTLQRAWTDAHAQDLDPPFTAPWFPAWMVIVHPGTAREAGSAGGPSEPEQAFDHLVALRRGHSDREDLDHRRALKDLHPDLLNRYLASIGE